MPRLVVLQLRLMSELPYICLDISWCGTSPLNVSLPQSAPSRHSEINGLVVVLAEAILSAESSVAQNILAGAEPQ